MSVGSVRTSRESLTQYFLEIEAILSPKEENASELVVYG